MIIDYSNSNNTQPHLTNKQPKPKRSIYIFRAHIRHALVPTQGPSLLPISDEIFTNNLLILNTWIYLYPIDYISLIRLPEA